jgi:PPOX class probable F420-dependent enzyme
VELPPKTIEAILAGWPVADLATLGPRGAPHLVPIVFARSGDGLWSPIDGKPKSGRELARVRHVRRDPRVALLLQHYDADWTRLWWLRVEGEAALRDAGDEEAEAAVAALRAKYPEYARVPVLAPGGLLLRIRVDATRSWCAAAAAAGSVETGRGEA